MVSLEKANASTQATIPGHAELSRWTNQDMIWDQSVEQWSSTESGAARRTTQTRSTSPIRARTPASPEKQTISAYCALTGRPEAAVGATAPEEEPGVRPSPDRPPPRAGSCGLRYPVSGPIP